MTDFKIEDLGNGKKRVSFEYNEKEAGTLSSTGKSHVIAGSSGFKPAGESNGKKIKVMFNVIRML